MKKTLLLLLICLFIAPMAFANTEDVTISFPEFDITLNGTKVNNASEKYPFVLYKGITYIPMTWDLSNSLGLNSKWHAETGLNISKNTDMTVYQQKDIVMNDIRGYYNASIVTFPVTVNGKVIDNANEEYPLLNFRNITYFPMTYNFMVTEFGSGYTWHNETGLSVSADKKLKIHIPKATVYTMDSSITELSETGGMTEAMMTLAPHVPTSSDDINILDFEILSNFSPLYKDYLMTTEMKVYDTSDNYMHTHNLAKPSKYIINDGNVYPFWISAFGSNTNFNNFTIELTLTPPAIARAILLEDYADINVEYVNGVFDVAKYKKEAVYVDSGLIHGSTDGVDLDLLKYLIVKDYKGVMKEGKNLGLMIFETGLMEYEDYHTRYTKLAMLDYIGLDLQKNQYYQDLVFSNNGNTVAVGYSDYLKLYDKDGSLLKIIINTANLQK